MFEALSKDSRAYLLTLARQSIASKSEGQDFPRNPPTDPLLHESSGAFVTLKSAGTLRGCIGRLESDRPLWETVAMMARAAAFEDPRFAPVVPEELDDLTIEISVLTPFEPMDDPLAVEVGKHGLLIEKGINRGVLLPQVAQELGWTAEEFLGNVCVKASLDRNAWKNPDTRLYSFTAVIISE